MTEDSNSPSCGSSQTTRRNYLRALGTGAVVGLGGVSATGTAAADSGDYERVIDLVEEGADPTGGESITPLLEEYAGDDTLVELPEGRYRMNSQLRMFDYENFAIVGDGATIVPGSMEEIEDRMVTEGEFSGPTRLFRLGTVYAPGKNLRFEGIDVDFQADNSGLRVIEAYVEDGLQVEDVTVHGRHDTGTFGPALFSVTDSSGYGEVNGFRAPDGADFSQYTIGDIDTGPTGILVAPSHEGELEFKDCELGSFPDNGLYGSSTDGRVVVDGGVYRNSNVANIRLFGDYSYVKNAKIVVDEPLPDDEAVLPHCQRGIRLDKGYRMWIYNTEFVLPESDSGAAVRVQDDVEWARVQDCSFDIGNGYAHAISVSEKAGDISVLSTEIDIDAPRNAIELLGTNSEDDGPAWIYDVTIRGDAGGSINRNAIRCTRQGAVFRALDVEQTGPDYRRAISFQADNCSLLWSSLKTNHIPIINSGDGTRIQGVEAESVNDYAALKLYDGHEDVTIDNCTLHNGYSDYGTENLTTTDVYTPEA